MLQAFRDLVNTGAWEVGVSCYDESTRGKNCTLKMPVITRL